MFFMTKFTKSGMLHMVLLLLPFDGFNQKLIFPYYKTCSTECNISYVQAGHILGVKKHLHCDNGNVVAFMFKKQNILFPFTYFCCRAFLIPNVLIITPLDL